MHPIIKQLAETNLSLVKILQENHDPKNKFEKIFSELLSLQDSPKKPNYLMEKLDEAFQLGHKDTNLFVLFSSYCIIALNNFNNKWQEQIIASLLPSIIDTIDIEQCHILVRAYYFIALRHYKMMKKDLQEAEKYYKKFLELDLSNFPRRVRFYVNLLRTSSISGRMNDFPELIKKIDSIEDPTLKHHSATYKIINYTILGNTKKIDENIKILEKYNSLEFKWLLSHYQESLKILQKNFDKEQYKTENMKILANLYFLMKNENFMEAEKIWNLNSKNLTTSIDHELIQYIPIHIYLNLNKLDRVNQEIQKLEASFIFRPFLDFFKMRLCLLENNFEEALDCYQSLMEFVQRYNAMERFLFEMQFANELKAYDLLRLLECSKTYMKKPRSTKINKNLEFSMIGDTPAFKEVQKLIHLYADLKEIIYISGETGTGKELVARALHQESKRKKEPFLSINCGSLIDTLLESELFGYEAGAFTGAQKSRMGLFEAAGVGTLFLDEFGEISSKMQATLLRVLETGEYRPIGSSKIKKINCCVLVASNKDLQEAIKKNEFREDLYYRINRFDIHLSPLRERIQDLPRLIEFFLNEDSSEGQTIHASEELIRALQRYSWPGNIRELRNEIIRCKTIHNTQTILEVKHFDFHRLQGYSKNEFNETKQYTSEEPNSFTSDLKEIILENPHSEQRLDIIIELFKKHKKLTRTQIMKVLKISHVTASKDLKTLMQRNEIQKIMPSKSVRSHYFTLTEKT